MSDRWRLDGYIRVSQLNDRDGGSQSPGQQRERIERWASAQGVEVVAWQVDLDQSGGRMERPGLSVLLERVRSRSTGGVVVAWLDRFSRAGVREALDVVEEIRTYGGKVVALDVADLDPEDPFGEYALTAMLAMSRLQLRRIAERWEMCRRDAIGRGAHMGRAPYGYRKGEGGRLRVEPREAEAVRRLFERRALRGHAPRQLARWLDEAAPKPGAARWTANTVRNMLNCRTYLGRVAHGPYVKERAHEPIVDPQLWHDARLRPPAQAQRGGYALTGLVRCASCGHRMGGSLSGHHRYRAYRCMRRHASGDCPAGASVSARRLEPEVVRQLDRHLKELELESERRTANALREMTLAANALRRHMRKTPRDASALPSHQAALLRRERRLRAAQDRLDGLRRGPGERPPGGRLEAEWAALPMETRRRILHGWVDAILVRPSSTKPRHQAVAGRIRVLFRGEAPPELVERARTTRTWTWEAVSPVRSLHDPFQPRVVGGVK